MDIEGKFYTAAATYILKNRFDIKNPTKSQITEMESILFNTWLRRRIELDERLTNREKLCLYFASQGKTYIEIAEILGISPNVVRNYEKEILRKLLCKSMKQAITIGIRYGDISMAEKI